MRGARDLDEIQKENLFHKLIEHRVRLYENLASDAISLLNIQLFILPITLSVTSLALEFVRGGSNESTASVLRSLANNVDLTLLRWGVMLGLVAVMLSALTYHLSRKRAAGQSRYLIQWHEPDLLETGGVINRYQENHEVVDNIVKSVKESTVGRYSDRIDDKRENVSQPVDSVGTSPSLLRAMVTLNLLTTLASVTLVFLSVFKVIYPPVIQIALVLTFVAAVLLIYALSFSALLTVLEYLLGASWRNFTVFASVCSEAFSDLVSSIADAIRERR